MPRSLKKTAPSPPDPLPRLADRAALGDLVARVGARNDQSRSEPLPDPVQWAVRPDHDTDQALFEELCFRLFSAGFSADVVRAKWPATRTAFKNFEPKRVAAMRAATLDKLAQDKSLIRNRRKLAAVVANAKRVRELAKVEGGFRAWLDTFPSERLYLAQEEIARRFDCIGPSAAEWFLLSCGYPYYFVTSHARRMLFRLGLTAREKPRREELNGVFLALAEAADTTPWRVSAELFLFASGFRVKEAICAPEVPQCPRCPLWDHCDRFNQR